MMFAVNDDPIEDKPVINENLELL